MAPNGRLTRHSVLLMSDRVSPYYSPSYFAFWYRNGSCIYYFIESIIHL